MSTFFFFLLLYMAGTSLSLWRAFGSINMFLLYKRGLESKPILERGYIVNLYMEVLSTLLY